MPTVVLSANTSWYIFNFRRNTILALIAEGYRVCVVAPKDSHTKKLQSLGVQYFPIIFDQQSTNVVTEFLVIFKFYYIYKKLRPSIVLNFTPKNNIYGALACKALGIPVISNISGLGTIFVSEGVKSFIVKHLYQISQNKSGFIFFQNTRDRSLLSSLKGIEKIPSKMIPGSGVDLDKFSFMPSRFSDVTIFLLCSRMLVEKGVLEYLTAAKNLRLEYGEKVQFRLLGPVDLNSPSAISYEDVMTWHQSGIIQYLGFTDDVLPELSKADCVVLPSFYGEGIPKSLIEAAAVGKPIITTDNVGCRDVVKNGVNGFLCEPRSAESLEKEMRRFMALSELERYDMSCKGRALAEQKFDEKIVIKAYLDVIKNLS